MISGDTIAAVATAPGRGGVAVVRVSGPDAFCVAERLSGRKPRAGRVSFDRYRIDGRLLDEGVTLAFMAPRSYTGEDVVEFQCHGGSVAPRRVLEACLASGARLARRGEFTERAFLNGRLSYEEAESVLDLVDAKTDRGADAALHGLTGGRRREMRGVYEALVDLSSTAEHALDVSEEDLPEGFCASLAATAGSIAARLDEAIRRAKEGKILREGALVVIAGPPNAGKSSLMNALLGEKRAIVSETPGTTRDSIEEWLDIDGWPVRLVDTAGLRETDDAIEEEGVERARELMARADVVVRLFPCMEDGSLETKAPEPPSLQASSGPSVIDVLSKCDLGARDEGGLRVSSKTGEGLDALRGAIAAALERRAAAPGGEESGLGGDAAALAECRALLAPNEDMTDLVLLANRVRAAAERLGEAVGAVYSADMLDALFSRFCVGK